MLDILRNNKLPILSHHEERKESRFTTNSWNLYEENADARCPHRYNKFFFHFGHIMRTEIGLKSSSCLEMGEVTRNTSMP